MKKKVLFIDRDGTLIVEPPVTFQVDNLEQLTFTTAVIRNLYFIRKNLDFELVIVSNQDGLGTPANPLANFESVQKKMLEVFENEGVVFDKIFIDPSLPEENRPTRKPGTAMLTEYLNGDYDLENSFVIGDRLTDVELAKNLGCKAIFFNETEIPDEKKELKTTCAFNTNDWNRISEFLFAGERRATVRRKTKETDIFIDLNLDGSGKSFVSTGLHFFDHILEQIGKHSGMDLQIKVVGDLEIDEHHTMEDTGIALGEALLQALGNKRGIERYGFYLPMDDCLCAIALDFGGRAWLVWDVDFQREKIGDVPAEMFMHFFKSLSDAARMNLHIRAEGGNEHHKAEGIFKSFAKAVKMAIRRDIFNYELPSTKGLL
ncbi:MAG: bifunctional histidinol-phosphatase/imidazoleglycerol-phosphate dehydratase HisB [Dysgonamonadaceae bacterium]|jgi:imidazoleglycerol-phosphate dehydratase/histidinol-phosphatase|nr:bifunctional histidinol-phosphatase/imidazoleglycerol-phosphate dehydratase HisB [Dysgonamonadaceae bacterium]